MNDLDPDEILTKSLLGKMFGIQYFKNDDSNNILLYKSILNSGNSSQILSLGKKCI